jgi:hypothetical protein
MFRILNGEKTSVPCAAVERQNVTVQNSTSPLQSTLDSFINVQRRGCPLFYIQVPWAKAKEMQYTGGLLSAFVLAVKETDYASTRKPNSAYGIHK